MSWHFSRALVEEFSAASCLDGEPSAPSNGSHSLLGFCASDRTTEFFNRSPSGMTFAPLTGRHGEALLMSFLAASRVKTSARPERALDLPASDQGSGRRWLGLLARFDPESCSWRTPQCSLFEDLERSLEIWPRWGSMRNGECWERIPSAPTISESESGFWPTPTHSPRDASCTMETALKWNGIAKQDSLSFAVAREEKAEGRHIPHGQLNPPWVEKLMGWADNWTSLQPMSHVKMCFWLMGFCDGEETGRDEVLRVLRLGNAAQEIQREIGRPVGIPEAALLLAELCEHSNRPDEARVFMACAEALEDEVRGVWLCEGTTGAPHRPGQNQQRAGEHPDAVQALSRLLAHHGQAYWQDGRWEDAAPRVAHGVAHRVDRLKALGNGQVPGVVAAAWRELLK